MGIQRVGHVPSAWVGVLILTRPHELFTGVGAGFRNILHLRLKPSGLDFLMAPLWVLCGFKAGGDLGLEISWQAGSW